MKLKILCTITILFALAGFAHAGPFPSSAGTFIKEGAVQAIGDKPIMPPNYTVANRPSPGANSVGALIWVTDGNSSTDCVTGGSTNKVLCRWTGSAWTNVDTQAAGSNEVEDEIYNSTNFDNDTTHGTSQDDFYDYNNLSDPDDDGYPSIVDLASEGLVKTSAAGVLSVAVAGTDYTDADATLTSIASLGTVADRTIYTTGVDTWAETPLTSFGRSIIDDADEATFKQTVNLEIGTDIQAQNATLQNVADSSYTGDDAITTVGTIGTGTWQGDVIGTTYAGTDLDTSNLAADLDFSDGDYIDLSAITIPAGAGANEGISIPAWVAGYTPTDAGEHLVFWDASNNQFKVSESGGFVDVGGGGGGAPVDAVYLLGTESSGDCSGTLTNETYLVESTGINITVTPGNCGTVTFSHDLTEWTGALAFNDNSTDASQTWTIQLSGSTDPVITFGDSLVNISTGSLQEAGNDVYTTADTVAAADGGTGIDSSGDTGVATVSSGTWSIDTDTYVKEGTATGGLLLGDSTPDTAGEIGYASNVVSVYDGTASRTVMFLQTDQAVSGIITHSTTLILDDGSGASPSLQFTDATNETWDISKADAGDLDIAINNASDRNVEISNAGAGDAHLYVGGDVIITGSFQSTASGDSFIRLKDNAGAYSPAGSDPELYFSNNDFYYYNGSTSSAAIDAGDSPTWTGQHDFSTTNASITLPTTVADSVGEISFTADAWATNRGAAVIHDETGTGYVIAAITSSTPTDGQVPKWNTGGTITWENDDDSGGSPEWQNVQDPTSDALITHDAGEETKFQYTGAFSAGKQFEIEQATGDPTGGILFAVEGDDDNIKLARFGDSTDSHYWEIAEVSANNYQLLNAGSATLNLAAASDLLIAGGQIDYNDLAGTANATLDDGNGDSPSITFQNQSNESASIYYEEANNKLVLLINQALGTIDLMPNNNTTYYLSFTTISNIPTISSEGGTQISFNDENLEDVGEVQFDFEDKIDQPADDEIELVSDDQEGIVFDLDTATDNEVEIKSSSGTGTTQISFSSLNMVTTGTISGKIPTSVDSTASPTSVTQAQAQAGTFFWNTLAGTKQFDLPAAEAGMAVCFKNGQGVSQILQIDPNGTEYIVMEDGTRTSAGGDYYGATADAGNQICLISDGTDWFVTSVVGTWTEE